MLLRSTLEKTLPVREGERHFWDREQRAKVFKGRYFGRVFERLTQEKAPSVPNATDEYGVALPRYRFLDVAIRRGIFGVEHRGRGGLFAPGSTPYKSGDVLPEYKRRIRHIEAVARTIKAGAALLAIGAVAVFGPPNPDSLPHPDIPIGTGDVGELVGGAGGTIQDASDTVADGFVALFPVIDYLTPYDHHYHHHRAGHRVRSPEGSQVGARTQRPRPTANLGLPND